MDRPLIIFDGKCHFCIAIVRFILARDKGLFEIVSVQDPMARKILREKGVQFVDLNTIYLVDGAEVKVRSSAALHIFGKLPFPWKAVSVFGILPVSFTDAMYKLISRNRYIFGRSDTRIDILNEKHSSRFPKEHITK